jgi:hypothetical protein
MDLISQGWRGMIIDEIRNMGDGAGLGREAEFRCTDMRLYFTGFRGWDCLLGCYNPFPFFATMPPPRTALIF